MLSPEKNKQTNTDAYHISMNARKRTAFSMVWRSAFPAHTHKSDDLNGAATHRVNRGMMYQSVLQSMLWCEDQPMKDTYTYIDTYIYMYIYIYIYIYHTHTHTHTHAAHSTQHSTQHTQHTAHSTQHTAQHTAHNRMNEL